VNEKDIQVTSSTTHGSQMAKTPHHISAFSLRLLTEIGQMMDANPDAAKRLKMPVLFLASPSAGYITAQTLVVDGGLIG
jgi:NAD(P)-dependent dehydrogenase (short-subunit alcohol dehydrogenase family)